MAELTNIFARSIKDLTLISQLPNDLTVLNQVKIPVGNLPAGINGCEALTLQQLRTIVYSAFNDDVRDIEQKVDSKLSENQELVDSKLSENQQVVDSKLSENQQVVDSKILETKNYTNQALSQLSTVANKFYPTLAAAESDIANIAVNQGVQVGEYGANGGLWYKATASATILIKSPHDPLTQSKEYTNNEINNLGILNTASNLISVAIIDEDDKRTWLEADIAGKPTDYSKSLIIESLEDAISEKILESVEELGIEQKSSVGLSVAIVDEDDKRTWLEADEAGKPTPYAAEKITEAINFDDAVSPSTVKSAYQTQTIKAVSGADIDCVGDSMTAGAGSNGYPYSLVLQNLLTAAGSSAVVRNSGVGGESAPTITARMGGYSFQVRVTDGVIPATTTPVVITLDQINGQTVRPLLQGSGGASGFIGDLAGVKGSIALVKPNGGNTWDAANYYTFTRSVAGDEVVVNRPEPFVTDYSKARQGDIKIIWIGQNGPSTERAIQDAKAIIQSMQALDKRYLVISRPTATSSDDALFFAEFGDRFIAAKKYLVEFGLADAGITPTEQDITDMSNYVIPLPLCASSSDRLHWSAAGYAVLANLIFKKLNQLGWI